jgi:glycosyltransferase involved in cell wall biosynthesis
MPYYAAMATLGSVAGCYVLYLIAERGGEAFLAKRLHAGHTERALAMYRRRGVLALMIPAILPPPAPFKLFVLLAGLAEVRPLQFVLSIAVARGVRYLVLGALAMRYGDVALELMRTRGRVVAVWVAVIIVAAALPGGGGSGDRRVLEPDISVVIPSRDEEDNVVPLHDELTGVLDQLGVSYEVILVDDGSTDATFEQVAAIQAGDANVKVIRFTRNFGQTAALRRGFAEARGQFIVTLDGDLQNDPRDIPRCWRWRAGRTSCRGGGEAEGQLSSRATCRRPLRTGCSASSPGVRLHDNGCSLKVYRANVVKPLKLGRACTGICRRLRASSVDASRRSRSIIVRGSTDGRNTTCPDVHVIADLVQLRRLMREAVDPTRPRRISTTSRRSARQGYTRNDGLPESARSARREEDDQGDQGLQPD